MSDCSVGEFFSKKLFKDPGSFFLLGDTIS